MTVLDALATRRQQGTTPSKWLSLVILCVGFLMIVVDVTIVNVALPSIRRDLGFSQADLAWVVNAYLIAFGGFLLLAGRLGDLVGRKRVFLIGLAVFTTASVLCGLSFSQPVLIAARFLQGVGGSVSSAVILGMVVSMFPEPGERARAFGIFAFVASAGASIGLLSGGLIAQTVSWHWIFFVNLPIGVATALLAARLLEADRGIGLGEGADVIGAVLVTVAVMSVGASARLIMRFGARSVLLGGQVLIAVSLVLLAISPMSTQYVRDWLVPMLLLGIGAGLAFPALTILAMADATPSDSGLASGVLNTTTQVGSALGLAVLATLSTNRTTQLMAAGNRAVSALSGGYHFAWAIGAGLVIASIVLAAVLLRSQPVADPESAVTEEEACA